MMRKRVQVSQILLLLVIILLSALELPRVFRNGDGLVFYAIDVGQGDASLFHFPDGSNVLIDAGTRKGAAKLVARLRSLGVKSIDILVASHPHEDHIGGMAEVIRAFPVGKIWDSGYNHGSGVQKEMLAIIAEKKIRFGRPRAGFVEKIGDARVEVVAPVEPIFGTRSDANNNTLVLRVVYGDIAFLMTGDIEEVGRRQIPVFPRATVLKVSHHGSWNGTDETLLRQVEPRVAVLSYGAGNPYGHPHKEVVKLLDSHGIETYATEYGDIRIETDGHTYSVSQEKNPR